MYIYCTFKKNLYNREEKSAIHGVQLMKIKNLGCEKTGFAVSEN